MRPSTLTVAICRPAGHFDRLRGDADALAEPLVGAADRHGCAQPAPQLHRLAIVDAAARAR